MSLHFLPKNIIKGVTVTLAWLRFVITKKLQYHAYTDGFIHSISCHHIHVTFSVTVCRQISVLFY